MSSKLTLVVAAMVAVVLATATVSTAQMLRAFPGAEGFGAYATGGRGGDVYHVTSLVDDKTIAGTLRYGLSNQGGARTIVFDIGGTINLLNNGGMVLDTPNLTIAGQTAPTDSGGICLASLNQTCSYVMASKTSGGNCVLQHLRFRGGTGVGDALGLSNAVNYIVDHCSASWTTDECLSVTNSANNVTIQWCIISEGLNNGSHAYGSLIAPQTANVRENLHHNLYAIQLGRMPRIAGQNSLGSGYLADFRNNIVYDWGTSGDWGTRGTVSANEYLDINWVNNYSIAGTNSGSASYANTVMTSTTSGATCRIYFTGSKIDYNKNATRDGIAVVSGNFKGSKTIMGSAFTIDPNYAVTTETVDSAYTDVLAGAGATKPARDTVDTRIVSSVTNQTGSIISSPGTLPTLAAGTTVVDTDRDGMPDAWESANGTNPAVADNNGDLDGDGYTNLEEHPIEVLS